MDKHIRTWRVHRALAWLYAAATLALLAYNSYRPGTIPPHFVFSAPVLCFVHALCAWGSRLCRPWARIASLVVGCLLLVVFPVGTIIGGYLLVLCARPWIDPRVHAGAARGGWHESGRRR
jgi:hypothetical protein